MFFIGNENSLNNLYSLYPVIPIVFPFVGHVITNCSPYYLTRPTPCFLPYKFFLETIRTLRTRTEPYCHVHWCVWFLLSLSSFQKGYVVVSTSILFLSPNRSLLRITRDLDHKGLKSLVQHNYRHGNTYHEQGKLYESFIT